MDRGARIYVAGAGTLIGTALTTRLVAQGYPNVVGGDDEGRPQTGAADTEAFFAKARPTHVFVAGGKSGGIRANQKFPADLMLDNLLLASHVLETAHRHRVTKLLYLASSCAYPKICPQPMRIDSLLTGPLEPTSRAYAIAKIAGMELCRAYRRQYSANFVSAIPADAFGPGDDFSGEDSHVVAALMRRMHEAKAAGEDSVEIWGTGTQRRDLIFSEDLADAAILVMGAYDGPEPINLGGGSPIAIRELAESIKDVVGYRGCLRFDASRPEGMPSKVLDWSPLAAMGWRPAVPLRSALERTYEWYVRTRRRSAAVSGR